MQNKIKVILSVACMSLFIFLGFASFGPDPSTNTRVAISNCEVKPPVSGQVLVSVILREGSSTVHPVKNAYCSMYITHQKVTNSDSCLYTVDFEQVIDFTTNDSGSFSFAGPNWTHDNSQDMIRIEVYYPGDFTMGLIGKRKVEVLTYDKFHAFIDLQTRFFL